MGITEQIESLLAEKFEEEEFSDCFLIEIKHHNKKLEVFIDSDTGVTFDTCQRVSRYLEHRIDEAGWLGDDYVLEVSSPGVGRPLMMKRQYPRNIGRKLEISLKEGGSHAGKLLAAGEDAITIEEEIKKKEGKKNVRMMVQTTIPFDAIKKAVVKVSF